MAYLTKNIHNLAEAISKNKVIAFPTDTFFAIGVDATNSDVVSKIFTIKGRAHKTPIPVLVANINQVVEITKTVPYKASSLMEKYWPGPLTIILESNSKIPTNITGNTGTVGVRLPDHSEARSLISMCGIPLTGTSANKTGHSPHKTSIKVFEDIGSDLHAIFDHNCGSATSPSTVLDFTKDPFVVVREGEISTSEINEYIN